jgi:hypothetical protein
VGVVVVVVGSASFVPLMLAGSEHYTGSKVCNGTEVSREQSEKEIGQQKVIPGAALLDRSRVI